MTRVALVTDRAGGGGTERHVGLLLAGLIDHGCEVHFVTSEPGPLTDLARSLGAVVSLVPRPGSVRYVRALAARLRSIAPEVVHTHSGRLACLAARLAGVGVIVETRHGIPESQRLLYRALPPARRWEGVKSSLAHVTICICQADLRWTIASGRPPSATRLIRNSIDPPEPPLEDRLRVRDRLGLPRDAWVVGFVGRLVRAKAPERFLEVVLRLREQARASARGEGELVGWICGDGPLERELRDRARRNGLDSSLRWAGEQPDARRLMPALDLLLVPSRFEGMPYVVLEALQAGLMVLATPVGGNPEILSGPVLGEGCIRWNAEEWAAAASRRRQDTAHEKVWREAARERVEEFTAWRNAAEIAGLYAELLQRPLCLPARNC